MASRAIPGTQTTAPALARTSGGTASAACMPWREMEADVATWDALADGASEPNPFLESWYLLPSLRALDPGGEAQLLLVRRGGNLLGLLPLVRSRRYYGYPLPHMGNWVHANCFLGAPLVARGAERDFWRALLGWADSHAGAALFLHLSHLPLHGPVMAALADELAGQARPAALVHREERAMLASLLAPEAYLDAALTSKKRKQLRRQFARLSELGKTCIERRDDARGLTEWTDAFLALEAVGWKGKAGSALACAPQTASLFRASLAGAAARGKLERLTLTLDGMPVAMLASFLSPPGAFSFKTTFDERLARFSPGVLLQRENLAMLGRSGIEWTDSCAAADHPMIERIWRERRAIGHVSIAIGGTLRRALFHLLARAETGRAATSRILQETQA